MTDYLAQAVEKLQGQLKTAKLDKHANMMKDAVCAALLDFCRQDGEFAQAVVQGGSFEDCMKAVATGCGSAISDLEAYRRGVVFYFPGAGIHMNLRIDLCASVSGGTEEPAKAHSVVLELADFL